MHEPVADPAARSAARAERQPSLDALETEVEAETASSANETGVRGDQPRVPNTRRVLTLQRSAGNNATAAFVRRWTNPVVSLKSDDELIKDALGGDTGAIKHVDSFATASANDTLKLIDMVNAEGSVWGRDAGALTKLWINLGVDLPIFANRENGERWKKSLAAVSSLKDDIPAASQAQVRFPKDVEEVVTQILSGNRAMVMSQMDQFGIRPDGTGPAAPLTDDQEDEIRDMQIAAASLAKLQLAQEHARKVPTGWRIDSANTAPPSNIDTGGAEGMRGGSPDPGPFSGAKFAVPVEFDPYQAPPLDQAPASSPLLVVPNVKTTPYAEVQTKYQAATDFIEYLVSRYPALYSISRGGKSADTAAFAAAATPQEARAQLGTGLTKLFKDIETTQQSLGGKLNVLDLTPVHAKMTEQGVRAPGSPISWNDPFYKSIAKEVVADHDFSNALASLGMDLAAQALFLVAPLAGPGAIFVMLAGAGVAAGKAYLSADRFEALSKASVSGPGLVSGEKLNAAAIEKQADETAAILAGLEVAGATAVAAVAGIQAAAPVGEDTALGTAARAEARRLIEVAAKEEPNVTTTLQGAANKHNAQLVGLENRLKTEESLFRKLADRAGRDPLATTDPEAAVRNVGAKLNDVLRYTVSSDPEAYIATKQAVYADLEAQGCSMDYEWNAWGDPKTPYRGVNSTWRSSSGQIFEVQFHTAESFAAKMEIHALYEEYRAADTSPERRLELDRIMREKYGVVEPPPGVTLNK